jgi:DNA-binding ferritin-like protein
MLELAILVKCLELYSHSAHHIVARAVFIPDHEMLGSIYSKMNGDYDNIIERFVGLKGSEALDEQAVLVAAVQKCGTHPLKGITENKTVLSTCLQQIKDINAKIEVMCKAPGVTQGTIQLLGNMADLNEVVIYKLQQRVK